MARWTVVLVSGDGGRVWVDVVKADYASVAGSEASAIVESGRLGRGAAWTVAGVVLEDYAELVAGAISDEGRSIV